MDVNCIICTDISTDSNPCIQINNSVDGLWKPCECKYTVHQNCFRTWLEHKEACIICKEHVYIDKGDLAADPFYTDQTIKSIGVTVFSYFVYPLTMAATFFAGLLFYTYIIIMVTVGGVCYVVGKN